jgi:hypothetical protein
MSRIIDDDPPIKTRPANKAYRDNYDRIFREEPSLLDQSIAKSEHPPTIGQREDGSWYWLDETWNDGDEVLYTTREAAQAAQDRYCNEVLGQ